MYKSKYEKYKEKYLALKYFLQMNMKGGKPLNNIFFYFLAKDDFIEYYREKMVNFNAYEILITLLNDNLLDPNIGLEPLTILVGATNRFDYDYDRFKDSELYSLYIDETDSTDPSRQYDMYTIGYKNIFSDIEKFPAESVNHIHFDFGVTEWCSIDYLKLAEHILINGGKIIFDLSLGLRTVYYFDNKTNTFKSGDFTFTKDHLERQYNISIDIRTRTILPKISDSVFSSGHISPMNGVAIYDSKTKERFISDPYIGYVDYCSERYPRLQFDLKKYTLLDYTYPVPIRIKQFRDNYIVTSLTILSFIFNQLFTIDEKDYYIKNKTLLINKVYEFILDISSTIDKIIESRLVLENFLNEFLGKEKTIKYLETNPITDNMSSEMKSKHYKKINEIFELELNKEYMYIEATKR